jgi:hypothetical protein
MGNTLHAGRMRDGNGGQAPGAIRASHASTRRKARDGSKPDRAPAAAENPRSQNQVNLDRGFLRVVGLGNMAAVRELLDAGAGINARNERGMTALMLCAMSGNMAIATFLLVRGADVNARDNEGTTAWSFANLSGQHAVRNLLKRYGGTK